MKTEDTIMAEYLLNGGKMLSETCKDCGAPLFETKNGVCCVVCKEMGSPQKETSQNDMPPLSPEMETEPEQPDRLHACSCHGHVGEEIESAVIALCRRVQTESRAEDCYLLMKGIKKGVQALSEL